jgi:hypothetical protein
MDYDIEYSTFVMSLIYLNLRKCFIHNFIALVLKITIFNIIKLECFKDLS